LRNEPIWLVRSSFSNENLTLSRGSNRIVCTVPDFAVAEGHFNATLFLGQKEEEILDLVSNAAEISIEGGNFFGTGSKGLPTLCKTLTHASWKRIS
jgi:lipopolysaccharide transport system ATP-binding protein